MESNGNTPYTVNIYYMDKNGQYQETPDRTKTEIGATDTTATVPDSAYIKMVFRLTPLNHLIAVR